MPRVPAPARRRTQAADVAKEFARIAWVSPPLMRFARRKFLAASVDLRLWRFKPGEWSGCVLSATWVRSHKHGPQSRWLRFYKRAWPLQSGSQATREHQPSIGPCPAPGRWAGSAPLLFHDVKQQTFSVAVLP